MDSTPVSSWFSLHLHDHLITTDQGLGDWAKAVGISLGVARKLAAGACTICNKTHQRLAEYGINLMVWNEQPGRSTIFPPSTIRAIAKSHRELVVNQVRVRPSLRHRTHSLINRILRALGL